MKRILGFISLITVAAALVIAPGPLRAAENANAHMTNSYDYAGSFDATDDDSGSGMDYICIVCYNDDGTIDDIDLRSAATGTTGVNFTANCSDLYGSTVVLPHYLVVLDPPIEPPSGLDIKTPAGLAYCQTPQPSAAAEAGCDAFVNIPDTAVGGAFVADAVINWAPGKPTSPTLTITAGNTARVLGMDASGKYYKIIWQCQEVWVPVATMGPNFDSVWNGAPLPTGVVE